MKFTCKGYGIPGLRKREGAGQQWPRAVEPFNQCGDRTGGVPLVNAIQAKKIQTGESHPVSMPKILLEEREASFGFFFRDGKIATHRRNRHLAKQSSSDCQMPFSIVVQCQLYAPVDNLRRKVIVSLLLNRLGQGKQATHQHFCVLAHTRFNNPDALLAVLDSPLGLSRRQQIECETVMQRSQIVATSAPIGGEDS